MTSRFRLPYDVAAADDVSAAAQTDCYADQDPGPTVQADAEQCDVNYLMRRFGVTGSLPVSARPATFGDFSDAVSYHEAVERVRSARESFDSLPSEVRTAFDNDPGNLLASLAVASSPSERGAQEREHLISLGLLNAVERVAPDLAPPAEPKPAESA